MIPQFRIRCQFRVSQVHIFPFSRRRGGSYLRNAQPTILLNYPGIYHVNSLRAFHHFSGFPRPPTDSNRLSYPARTHRCDLRPFIRSCER